MKVGAWSGTASAGRRTPRRLGVGNRFVVGFLLGGTLLGASPAAGQWVSSPREGWVDLTLIHHDTRREFDTTTSRRRIFAGGRALTRSMFLTANIGLLRGLDTWIQVPLHHLRFDDAGGKRVSSGVGDPKAWLRAGPELLGLGPWPVAIRGGVKMDSGTFELDAEVVPLGEGQVDLELMLELGRSFHPRPLWTSGWIGYRWRLENTEAGVRPGNERFWWWSVGGNVRSLGWQAALEGLSGEPWIIQNLSIASARRELLQFFVKADYPVGPGRASLGIRAPLSGRNLPGGAAVTAGYFFR